MHSAAMNPRALLQRLMDEAMLNPNSLSEKTGKKTKQPQIHRFLEGTTLEPKRSTLEPVAKVFGVSVEAFFDPKEADRVWAERFAEKAQTKQSPKGGHWVKGAQMGVTLAHVLSQVSPMIEPTTIPWESILAESLPALFRAVIPDDAMGAEYPRGCIVNFSTAEGPPRARDLVLVADADGGVYFREYQTGRGNRWQAVAQISGYQTLDSEADGLRVLAISMGRWGRRG